jgi:hypothetical protein
MEEIPAAGAVEAVIGTGYGRRPSSGSIEGGSGGLRWQHG